MKEKILLIIENCYPTIHNSLAHAVLYLNELKDKDDKFINYNTMYALINDKDLKEGFVNCKFYSL